REVREYLLELRQRARGCSPHCASLSDHFAGQDSGLSADRRPVPDARLLTDAHLSPKHDVVADLRASGDAGLGRDNTVAPDLHVVGDLNEVVNLGPLADYGGPKRATVHGGVASDFDVILNDGLPELRELVITALGKNVAEAVGPDYDAGVKDYAVADPRLRVHND